MDEIWREIPGFGGFYEASNKGSIRVKERTITKPHSRTGKPVNYVYPARVLNRSNIGKGYFGVHLGVDGKKTSLRCCRAVLLAFHGFPPEGYEACHGDGNPGNDHLENLRWDTHFSNNQDRKAHGKYAVGVDHVMAKLTEGQVRKIRFEGITYKEASAEFNISSTQFYRIKRGETWLHIQP